ncbi:hypothetical protein ABTN38_19800, partial [Acinetobacter baumannii]
AIADDDVCTAPVELLPPQAAPQPREAAMIDETADWADEPFIVDAPSIPEPTTPFAFLSDHAFWDLVPELERDEEALPPAALPAPAPVTT